MTCIPLHKTWQMNLLWPMNPTSTRAEMTCIPLHKTWQMSLLWPMDHLVPEQRWLAYHYTKLGSWTYFAWTQWQRFESSSIHHFWDTPQHFLKTHFCLESGFLSLLELQKSQLVSRVIENWCLEYCFTKLGRWTYYGWWTSSVPEQRWLAYHYTKPGRWTYFGWTNGKGLKALAFTISEIPHSIFSKHIFA